MSGYATTAFDITIFLTKRQSKRSGAESFSISEATFRKTKFLSLSEDSRASLASNQKIVWQVAFENFMKILASMNGCHVRTVYHTAP